MKPVSDLTVIEVGEAVSAPFSGKILSDMGADVIKVERPNAGDRERHASRGRFASGNFPFLNHGKKSIELNLKHEDGLDALRDLASQSDILIENLSPGAIHNLGIDRAELADANENLIIVSIKAYGNGPFENRVGTDYSVEIESGMTYMTGLEDHPLRVGFSVVDITTGTYVVLGILNLLNQLPLRAEERYFKVGLFETATLLMGQSISYSSIHEASPGPLNEEKYGIAIYDLFETANGEKIMIGVWGDKNWKKFAEAFNLEHLLENPDLKTEEGRLNNQDMLMEEISEKVRQYEMDAVVEKLDDLGLIYAPQNEPVDLLNNSQLNEGDKLVSWNEGEDDFVVPLPPMEGPFFDYQRNEEIPKLGEDTFQSLRSVGYSEEKIREMAREGSIGEINLE